MSGPSRRPHACVLLLAALTALAASCSSGGGSSDRVHTIAFLRAVVTQESTSEIAILAELRRGGYIAGRNLRILGAGKDEAYPDAPSAERAVRTFVRQGSEILFAFSTTSALAAQKAAGKTPVLFLLNDPTASGLVPDERRPDGHLTGVTFRVPADRTLALARQVIPNLSRIGLAYPAADPAAVPHRDRFTTAAQALGMTLVTQEFTSDQDVAQAIDVLGTRDGVQALLLSTSPTATRALPAIEKAATARKLPVVASTELASFAVVVLAPDGSSLGAQLGKQALRLMRGESVSSIPVEDPRRFRVTVNQAVASSLGLTLSQDVLREADVVRR